MRTAEKLVKERAVQDNAAVYTSLPVFSNVSYKGCQCILSEQGSVSLIQKSCSSRLLLSSLSFFFLQAATAGLRRSHH